MFDGVDIANGQHEFKRSQIGSLIEYPHFPSHYTVQQVLQEQITMMGQKTTPEYITTIEDLLDLDPIWNTSVKKAFIRDQTTSRTCARFVLVPNCYC